MLFLLLRPVWKLAGDPMSNNTYYEVRRREELSEWWSGGDFYMRVGQVMEPKL
jgi:hypothetical protein